jgi:glutathione S-transferase
MPRFVGQQGDMSAADQAEGEELPRVYEYLENQIPEKGYLVSDRFALADITAVSPITTLQHIDCRVGKSRFPKVASYSERICKRDSFAKAIAAELQFIAGLG